jgi:hypothetical protein
LVGEDFGSSVEVEGCEVVIFEGEIGGFVDGEVPVVVLYVVMCVRNLLRVV